jgi:hypothetical protein
MQKLEQGLEVKSPEIQEITAAPVRFWQRLTPKFVRDVRQTLRESGVKGVVSRYGWKIVAAFFVYYLVRDTILYILIPYAIAKGLIF